MRLYFGFDIGIASVGWAVVDRETFKILECGSNTFESADAQKNVDRRRQRQLRRLHRRHFTRIQDFRKLWLNYCPFPTSLCTNRLELRVKGLSERLSADEVFWVLENMLQHRGISYLDEALDESNAGKSDYQKGLMLNEKELKEKYPCQIQWDRLQKFGAYRGNISVVDNGEKITYSNVFTTSAYRKELEAFFDMQKASHDFMTDEFIAAYMRIFNRKRKYYEGPGKENSRTDYGIYTTKIDPNTGEFHTETNLFDKLIGRCSVYPEEQRGAGASYTAQEYNALNDLNNLTVNGRKLEEEEKRKIIEEYKKQKTVKIGATKVRAIIANAIGEEIESFSGARMDKNSEEMFHTFELYRKMRNELEKEGRSIEAYDAEMLDEIAYVLTLNTEREGIEEAFLERGMMADSAEREFFVKFRKENGNYFSKWQSFSIRLMRELIPALYEQPKEQMTLLTEMGVYKTNIEKYKGLTKIPTDELLDDLYNPVVRRSVSITIQILNALLKKYGYPDEIDIEMPRDRNDEERKERIRQFLDTRKKELKKIEKKIFQEYGIGITSQNYRNHKELALKLKLWNEQNGYSVYSGKAIEIEQLLNDPNMFEVDHIIPRSISLDDSRNNKVLVLATENQNKGNLSPYRYFLKYGLDWNAFRGRIATYNLSKKKKEQLLLTLDITKEDVRAGFISRNLNDTRYASRVVLNTIQDFFRANEKPTKIKTVRGSFTHQMRGRLELPKNREDSFSHHAIDAALICYAQMGYDTYRAIQNDVVDVETGEILDENKAREVMSDAFYQELLFSKKWLEIKQEILDAEKRVKYWRKVDRKSNRRLCKQTIYGTRTVDEVTYKIKKIDIRDEKKVKEVFGKKLDQGKTDDFLMASLDPKTFEMLVQIYQQYREEKNPFVQYEIETGEKIRKYAKNGKGPVINNLKYKYKKLGSHIDISHKYGHEKNSKKVVLTDLVPLRMDVYRNTETGRYYLVGVKQSDCKYENGLYSINKEVYAATLIREGVLQEGDDFECLSKRKMEFMLSFYKDEVIMYEKNGQIYKERFLSRTKEDKNIIETKPIHSEGWKDKAQNQFGLTKTTCIKKIRTDILGNQYPVEKEKFSMEL